MVNRVLRLQSLTFVASSVRTKAEPHAVCTVKPTDVTNCNSIPQERLSWWRTTGIII